MVNISSLGFHIWQHLEQHQNESQLQHWASIPSVPVGQLYHHMATDIQHIIPCSHEGSRRYSFNLDTVFTHRSLCNCYRITYTSRFQNILLPFLLMSTCQISVPTFTTRYHAIYNCGWWCRGSSHLQIWWQGLATYKTLWESWPACRVYTYRDRESV